MIDRDSALSLLTPGTTPTPAAQAALDQLGFDDPQGARQRLSALCASDEQRQLFEKTLSPLLYALSGAANPDGSLVNFERFVQVVADRTQLFRILAGQPRAVEILVKLFVGSQFLTEILLRNPHYLDHLTAHKRLAEFKSRQEYIKGFLREYGLFSDSESGQTLNASVSQADVMQSLRRFQQWEILRLAACDTFGLMDLKTVTLQLALLADALVQLSLDAAAELEGVNAADFTVLAFGKLGGEELNYSSDIDLIFLCREQAERYWGVAQRMTRILSEATPDGFLYRVDLRLRPWGTAGPLVTTVDAYVDYLERQGRLWEKQALLKARPVAGDLQMGYAVLDRVRPYLFQVDPTEARRNILEMKRKTEAQLRRKGKRWGDVKRGPGGIRDVEFLTQYLQLVHGGDAPEIRTANTLDGLIRLADSGFIFPEEYRRLSSGYSALRTIEHALQLMHNVQEHVLPESPRHLDYLARRLDFPDLHSFVQQYDRHTRSIRDVFENHLLHDVHPLRQAVAEAVPSRWQFGAAAEGYHDSVSSRDAERHSQLLRDLSVTRPARLLAEPLEEEDRLQVTIVGIDRPGALSAICGLMFAHGFDIESGHVFTGQDVTADLKPGLPSHRDVNETSSDQRRFVNVFQVRVNGSERSAIRVTDWLEFESELCELLRLAREQGIRKLHGQLARRVAAAFDGTDTPPPTVLPLAIEFDNSLATDVTVLNIRGTNTPGFLYELTNAIAVSGLSVSRMTIRSLGSQVLDTLHVVNEHGQKLESGERLNELRAAIVLIKHFTHLLPSSPNPQSALLHFQAFLENLFRQPNWLEQLSPLQDSEVLAALARLLGISHFLWDDFLRLQHENLFPVVTNVQGLERPRDRRSMRDELLSSLAAGSPEEGKAILNAFKDREMMRVDMRHILGLQDKFGMFARELTDVAELVVQEALRLTEAALTKIHGLPLTTDGQPSRLCVCALGKFGGRELGYASDIELMFIYDGEGRTAGPESVDNREYYQKLVETFRQMIDTKRKGIFEVDLRLRPYGQAGRLAVSLPSFETYFGPQGEAWPYERQALVKLRPVAGNASLKREVVSVRDRIIYRQEPFDVTAMRAIREKQIRQLVQAGTLNAKLSPGGLVDCEYLVQALQMTFGHLHRSLREPNTREAMKALQKFGILTGETRVQLRDAYRFLRRLIDALRMVRGDASDLTVPPVDSEEFIFLAKRLGNDADADRLRSEIERQTANVVALTNSLEELLAQQP